MKETVKTKVVSSVNSQPSPTFGKTLTLNLKVLYSVILLVVMTRSPQLSTLNGVFSRETIPYCGSHLHKTMELRSA